MQHLTDESIAAALDPSGGGEAGVVARAHAAECDSCAAELASDRAAHDSVDELLSLLDGDVVAAPNDIRLAAIRALARSGGRSAGRPSATGNARKHAGWAAAVALVAAAAAAATIPARSPVRQLIERHTRAPLPVEDARPAIVGPEAASGAAQRGVAIQPSGTADVMFQSSQSVGELTIVQGADSRMSVEATGDGPTYEVGSNSIVVHNDRADSVSFHVAVPPASQLPNATVRVGDRIVYRRLAGRVVTPASDRRGPTLVVPMAR